MDMDVERASSPPRCRLQGLVDAGGYAGVRGQLRVEGRDYVMRDGDVMTVRFTS